MHTLLKAAFPVACIFLLAGAVFCPPVFADRSIIVEPTPSSGVSDGTAGLEVQLKCTVNLGTVQPTRYTIYFGDGEQQVVETTEYSHTFTHTYTPGLYRAKCVIAGEIGLEKTSDLTPIVVAKWSFKTGGEVDSSPAVGPDGTVYVGSDDHNLFAIDPDTGKEKWRYTTGGEIQGSPAVGPAGKIYIGSTDGNMYAINPNGKEDWIFSIGSAVFSSPAIGRDGRLVYIGASDNKLYALSAGSGTAKWTFETDDKIISSPSIGNDGIEDVVYFGSIDGHIYAVSANNGAEKWRFATDTGVYGSPAIGSDGRIYVGELMRGTAEEYNYKFYCINVDGTLHWTFEDVTGFYSSPSIGPDNIIYVGSWDGVLIALNSKGNSSWGYRPGPPYASINSSPAIGANGIIYVGSKKEKLYAVLSEFDDRQYGQTRQDWTFGTHDDIMYSSPVIDDEGTIYFGARDGYIYALNPGNLSPADSPWPMYRGNAAHTGLAGEIIISDIISTSPTQNSAAAPRDLEQVKINFSPKIPTDRIMIDTLEIKKVTRSGDEKVEGFRFLDFTRYNNIGYRPTAVFERLNADTPLAYDTTYRVSIDYMPNTEVEGEDETDSIRTFSFSFTTEKKPVKDPNPDPNADFGCFIMQLFKALMNS